MKTRLITIVLISSLSIPVALAVRSSRSPDLACAAACTETPMGSKDLTGGTTKLGELDPQVTPTDASGTVCNAVGVPLTDITFSLEKGTATGVDFGGSNHDMSANGKTCKITLSSPMPTSGSEHCGNYKVKGVSQPSGETGHIVLNATPSTRETVGGNPVELNILPSFQLNVMSDIARNGIGELYYAGVEAIVSNNDSSRQLNQFTGTVSFPGTASATLTGVQLAGVSSTASISGNDFTLTNFTPIDPGGSCRVIVLLSDELGGQPMRVQLQATFTP